MQKFNYHTHTYRCRHAEDGINDEEIVKDFIKEGFHTIAFTDHCPQKEIIDTRKNMRMDYSEKDEYLASIKYLKEKYKEKIDILTGYEVEYLPGQEINLMELKDEVDKVVLGQHFIYDENKNLKIFRHAEFTDEDLITYAEYIKEAIKKGIPDIIAHPDVFMLSRETFGENEAKVTHIICKAAEENNIPLEINLCEPSKYVLGKKKVVKYPCAEFWKIASDYNIKVLYGIDVHYRYQIPNYKESINLANEIIGKAVIDKLNFIKD